MKKLNFQNPVTLLSVFFILCLIGFVSTPLSVKLVYSGNTFSWEDDFKTNKFTLDCDSFQNCFSSEEGLKASGLIILKDPNQNSGYYAYIRYTFNSERNLEKTVIEVSSTSPSQTNALRIFVNNQQIDTFLGSKAIDISNSVKDEKQFTVELHFWVVNTTSQQDLTIQYLKVNGFSSDMSQPQPEITEVPHSEILTEELSDTETLYAKLSNHIRDTSNSFLTRTLARIGLGWLYIIKEMLGVEI